MKRIINILLLIALITFPRINYAKGQTYEEKYNLDFRIVDNFYGWYSDVNNSYIRFSVDSTDINHPIKFSQAERWGFREKMSLTLYMPQLLLLPAFSDSLLEVKISYKCKNLETGRLFVTSLNKQMDILITDSICLQNDDNFREDSLEMTTKDARFLFLSLQAVGKDSTYTEWPVGPVEQTIPHEISISRITLQSGRTNINDLPFQDIEAPNVDKSKILVLPPDTLLTGKQLSRISGRITALGETVHGSGKIGWTTTNFIKSSVLNNQTNLIIYELPLLMMLYFNKYVQGANDINENKLKELTKKMASESEPVLELAKWLREYNKTALEKVSFWGMDCKYQTNELEEFLKDYLQIINQEARSSTVDSLISVLDIRDADKIKDMAITTLHIIKNNWQELSDVLAEDIEIITFYLESLIKAEVTYKNNYYERDWHMFKTTSFLIDYHCKPHQTVVISCHLSHANYLTDHTPLHKSYGSYMKKEYKEEYGCVLQIVGEDTVNALTGKEFERKTLPPFSSNSLEAVFSKSGVKYGYIDAKELNEIVKLRMQGSHHEPTSRIERYINPRSQVQGVLFIN